MILFGVIVNDGVLAALGAELGFTPVDDTENADVCIADVLNILSVLVVGNNEGVGQRVLSSEGVDRGCGRIVTDVQCGQGGRLNGGEVLSEVLGEDFTIQGGNGEVFVDRNDHGVGADVLCRGLNGACVGRPHDGRGVGDAGFGLVEVVGSLGEDSGGLFAHNVSFGRFGSCFGWSLSGVSRRSSAVAAGAQCEHHDESEQKCKGFLHLFSPFLFWTNTSAYLMFLIR